MIRYFAAHPTAANLLMLLLLVIGVLEVGNLKRETFPDLPADEIRVDVVYPGALPEDVEDAICQRVEDAIDSVEGIDRIASQALESVGRVTIEVGEGFDPIRVLDDVQAAVGAIDDLPDAAEAPVVTQLGRNQDVAAIAVTGEMSAGQLKDYCEALKRRLQRLPEVSIVTLEGFSQRQLRIEVSAATLMQYGLSADDIASTIGAQSLDLPVGTLEPEGQGEFVVRFADERRSIQELESLVVVAGDSGGELRLGEIASIIDTFENAEEQLVFDGRRAGLLRVRKTRSEDSLRVVNAMRAFIEVENERAPVGTELVLTEDRASIVSDRLGLLVTNGWQGMVLVLLTLWLFFSFRLAFWVAMSLPVAFFGAFFVMSLTGYSLNMLTMVALLLALGLLMDDGIVLAENVATHYQRGKSALRAAVDGTLEVKNGVLSSFFTTVAMFGPISFLQGDLGVVLGVLPVVLITVLVVSLVEAFLILPAHLNHALAHGQSLEPGRFRQRFERGLEFVRERLLGRLVDRLVTWRWATLGGAVGLFVATLGLLAGGVIKFQSFPSLDGDLIQARVLAPQGTSLRRTEELVGRMTAGLDAVSQRFDPAQPDGQSLIQHVNVRFNQHADAFESGPHVATISVDLLPAGERDAAIDDILGVWREAVGSLPDTISLQFAEPSLGPAGRALEIEIAGDRFDELAEVSRQVQEWFRSHVGVFDVFDDLRPGKPQFDLELVDGAVALGFSAQQIASQLRSAFSGRTARDLQVGYEDYEVDVQYAAEDRGQLSNLVDFYVTAPGGRQVPLESVARVEATRGYARIARVDGQRVVTVVGSVNTDQANVSELIRLFRAEVEADLLREHPGVEIRYRGEIESGQETGASLMSGLMLGLVLIFLLLSFQFRSYLEPLVVMTAIPMGLIGVVVGHVVMGIDLSLPSMMGFVSLAGIVVNDSILLVEFIKKNRRAGMAVDEAARRASRERFRAVLLTSITTVAGMSPLLLETSLQAQVLIPLAVSVVFGLAASTVLVLLLLPATYTMLADFGWVENVEREELQ